MVITDSLKRQGLGRRATEGKEPIRKAEFYRISLIRTYSSTLDRGTPDPFAEIRAFEFLDHYPTPMELQVIYSELEVSINALEIHVLTSLQTAKDAMLNKRGEVTATQKDRKERPIPIAVKEVTKGRPTIEIDGYEVEDLDVEEVMQTFKYIEKIRFNRVYHYFALFDASGEPIFEYDDNEIQKMIDELSGRTLR